MTNMHGLGHLMDGPRKDLGMPFHRLCAAAVLGLGLMAATAGAQTSQAQLAGGVASATAAGTSGSQPDGGARKDSQGTTNSGSNVVSAQALPSPKLDLKKEALDQTAPMDARTTRALIEELYKRTGAASAPAKNTAKPVASRFPVDLSPGATPPVVRIFRGQGASVSFLDSAGNPWPIEKARNFYDQAMTVTQLGPHVVTVESNSDHASGSVTVLLKGLATPVTFTVVPSQSEIDYRADLIVPGRSPDAPARLPGGLGRVGITERGLENYLFGQTPEGARRLEVQDLPLAMAWQDASGRLILRTQAMVASPGPYQVLPSSDGTTVYELPAVPVLRVSVDGLIRPVHIKGLTPGGAGGDPTSVMKMSARE
ncbi:MULTISPECIES: DotH/IcmK family type IV secretion protein [unclassified Cupriavidus]|uniref:DotH/IcmK family type IV secretion protein n=1 Tax=unclassified Cupriavidus TaxID=2640874 RepID=UPI00313E670A